MAIPCRGLVLGFVHSYRTNIIAAALLAFWFQAEVFGFGNLTAEAVAAHQDLMTNVVTLAFLAAIFLRMTLGRAGRVVLTLVALLLVAALPLIDVSGTFLLSKQNIETLAGSDPWEAISFLKSLQISSRAAWAIPAFFSFCSIWIWMSRDGLFRPEVLRRTAVAAAVLACVIPCFSSISSAARTIFCSHSARAQVPASTVEVSGMTLGHQHVDNYVLVMSETLSEKGLSLYGCPVATTPFLDSIPTRRIARFIAPSMATTTSVPLMLSEAVPGKTSLGEATLEPNLGNTVFDIARKAGLQTYWLSSQRRWGGTMGSLPALASKADRQVFVTPGDDFALVPAFAKAIAEPVPQETRTKAPANGAANAAANAGQMLQQTGTKAPANGAANAPANAGQKLDQTSHHVPEHAAANGGKKPLRQSRFIFVHTYGAHEDYCDRLAGAPALTINPAFRAEKELGCYLRATAKVDSLVHALVGELERAGQTYSLILTADHAGGLRRCEGGGLLTNRKWDMRSQYEVPFVMIGSGVSGKGVADVTRDAQSLYRWFPSWIGVKAKGIPQQDIFAASSDSGVLVKAPDGRLVPYSHLESCPRSMLDILGKEKK